MIIDARERFCSNAKKKRSAAIPFSETTSVVRLDPGLKTQSGKSHDLKQKAAVVPAAVNRHQSRELRETFGTMVFRSNDITEAFYKRLANSRWWDKPQFKSLISADSSDLMNALMGMAYDPPRPTTMERFLREARIKFQDHHQTPLDNRIVAVNLIAAINDVNRNRWDESTRIAWQNALHPDNIFGKNSADQHDHG